MYKGVQISQIGLSRILLSQINHSKTACCGKGFFFLFTDEYQIHEISEIIKYFTQTITKVLRTDIIDQYNGYIDSSGPDSRLAGVCDEDCLEGFHVFKHSIIIDGDGATGSSTCFRPQGDNKLPTNEVRPTCYN